MNGHTLFVYDFRNHIAHISRARFIWQRRRIALDDSSLGRKSGWENWRMRSKKMAPGKDRRQGFQKQIPAYCGQGTAECGRTVSSGKLNAPSMALEVVPISNHCSRGMFCGW